MKIPEMTKSRDEIESDYGWRAEQIVRQFHAEISDQTFIVHIKEDGGLFKTRANSKLSLRKDDLGKYWLRVSDDKNNVVDFDMDYMYKNMLEMRDYCTGKKVLSWKFTSPKKTSQLILSFQMNPYHTTGKKGFLLDHYLYELGEIGHKFASQRFLVKPVSRPSLNSAQVANMLRVPKAPRRKF